MDQTDNYIFGVLTQEDKLDGSNYSLWSFMVKNVLVAKGLWDYISGDEPRPGAIAPTTPRRGEGQGGATLAQATGHSSATPE